ncbi:MAG: hypothetical protein ACYDG2_12090 [Ruminiclostridium sp.]
MMNVDKIMRLGSLLFAVVLFILSMLKYFYGQSKTGVCYFIGALGFLIVYLSYWKKQKGSG